MPSTAFKHAADAAGVGEFVVPVRPRLRGQVGRGDPLPLAGSHRAVLGPVRPRGVGGGSVSGHRDGSGMGRLVNAGGDTWRSPAKDPA